MFVRNWMSAPPVTIEPHVALQTALDFMEKHHIRRAPVVGNGALLGIVTKGDILAVTGGEQQNRRGRLNEVSDVMKRTPVTVAPDATIETAAQIMLSRKISGLPVVADGHVVGIITESDLFRALCEIMGVGERGARLTMQVSERDDLLEAIGKKLNGLSLKTLVTFHDAKSGKWDVVLRVRGRVPASQR